MSVDDTDNLAAITPAAEVVITIGRDGRVYFHDLGPALMRVAQALAPDDTHLLERARAARILEETSDELGGDEN